MSKDDLASWHVIARRLIPFVVLQILLRFCWLLVLVGYGRHEAREFAKMNLADIYI